MVISGIGGQGLITLLQIIAQSALSEGYEVRTSELHGLSQRGGSVEVHIRFGNKIYSPMVSAGEANLILGLEMQEALKAGYYSNHKTNFLINQFIQPIPLMKNLTEKEITANLKKIGDEDKSSSSPTEISLMGAKVKIGTKSPSPFAVARVSKNINIVPAEKICQEKLGNSVVSGVYLLGLAVFKKLIPLNPNSIKTAIKKIIPENYLELNLKAFNLAESS